MDLRSLQRDGLTRALMTGTTTGTPSHPNNTSTFDSPSTWRVLVYDRHCRDVVFALVTAKKNVFRDCGVTLKMLIDSPRERIPDVAAVYLIRPTEDNVDLIAKDAAAHLYDSFHVNFSTPVSSRVLELFARKVGESGTASSIARVFDQFMGFVALDKNLFTLNQTDSFTAYNSTKANEPDVERAMEAAADGLVDAIVTLGRVPIVRAPRDGPAEMVARKVASKLEKLYKERAFALENTSVDQRPVLLILDRGLDMITPLHHSETYQCLVDDLVGPVKLNKISLLDDASKKNTTCDLDPETDAFWSEFQHAPFPHAVEKQIELVKEVDERAKRMAGNGVTPGSGDGGGGMDSNSTRELMDAVNALPEITERKRSLAMHHNILQTVFRQLKAREIPTFHDVETRASRGRVTQTLAGEIMALLKQPNHHYEDKTRLACIYALSSRLSSSAEMDELESTLLSSIEKPEEKNEARRALSFVRRVQAVSNNATMSQPKRQSTAAAAAATTTTTSMESLLASTMNWQAAFSGVQEKLQTIANAVTGTGETWCPSARAIDAVCGGDRSTTFTQQESVEIDRLLYLDPKSKIVDVPIGGARFRGQINRAVLFMVGGGSYTERHNITTYAEQRKREVIYGCTEMMNAGEFLRQMKDSA